MPNSNAIRTSPLSLTRLAPPLAKLSLQSNSDCYIKVHHGAIPVKK
jgi:hypothetical protein